MGTATRRTLRTEVVSDPTVLGGVPVLRGTRVPVAHVLAELKAGTSRDEIFRHYPACHRTALKPASLGSVSTDALHGDQPAKPDHLGDLKLARPRGRARGQGWPHGSIGQSGTGTEALPSSGSVLSQPNGHGSK